MDIKKFTRNTINFGINRFIELFALSIGLLGLLLLIALFSYSPQDPNFIFPDNSTIKNLLGYRGSFVSDFFFQSFGIISILIPISLILSAINIFIKKNIFQIIENIFYILLYLLFGSLFFTYFYSTSFDLLSMEMVVLLDSILIKPF